MIHNYCVNEREKERERERDMTFKCTCIYASYDALNSSGHERTWVSFNINCSINLHTKYNEFGRYWHEIYNKLVMD